MEPWGIFTNILNNSILKVNFAIRISLLFLKGVIREKKKTSGEPYSMDLGKSKIGAYRLHVL